MQGPGPRWGPGAGGVSILIPLQGQASDTQWEPSPAFHRSSLNPPTDVVIISKLILSGALASGSPTPLLGPLLR